MKEKYKVYICDYLEALPSDAQSLSVAWYQIEDLIQMLEGNEKCLIIYPPNEVQNEK